MEKELPKMSAQYTTEEIHENIQKWIFRNKISKKTKQKKIF